MGGSVSLEVTVAMEPAPEEEEGGGGVEEDVSEEGRMRDMATDTGP